MRWLQPRASSLSCFELELRAASSRRSSRTQPSAAAAGKRSYDLDELRYGTLSSNSPRARMSADGSATDPRPTDEAEWGCTTGSSWSKEESGRTRRTVARSWRRAATAE